MDEQGGQARAEQMGWIAPDGHTHVIDSVTSRCVVCLVASSDLFRPGDEPIKSLMVPRSFVESVLYSGAFEGEDLDKLYAEAARLIDADDPAYLQGAHPDEITVDQSRRLRPAIGTPSACTQERTS